MYLKDNTLLQGGKYKIVRFLSSGGFGNTYEAELCMIHKRVAIKEFFVKNFCNRDSETSQVSVSTSSNQQLVNKLKQKFIDEAASIWQFNHPNIVRVTDVFEENGTAYYVMDYINGISLHSMLKRDGALYEEKAIRYIKQVADALQYVHSQNRLHLDIKPGNIMVDANDNAILIDFGASKQYDEQGENTSTLLGLNTIGYAPVEQMSRSFSDFNPSADVYALGATLYKLLTNITPKDSVLLMTGDEELSPLPSSISQTVRNAVEKAMIPQRKKRTQTIIEFINEISMVNPLQLEKCLIEDVDEVTILECDSSDRSEEWGELKIIYTGTWMLFAQEDIAILLNKQKVCDFRFTKDGNHTAKIFQSPLVVEVVDNGKTFSAKYSIEKKNNYICRIEYQRFNDKYSIELEQENGKKCQVL